MTMKQMQYKLDALVRRLKQTAALETVRFVREYAAEYAETPVRGWLAAVSVTRIVRGEGFFGGFLSSSVKGESYEMTAEIRLYAPTGSNGSGLSQKTGALLSLLEQADEEHMVTGAQVSPIEFDADCSAVFRRVELQMRFCLCEVVQNGVSL